MATPKAPSTTVKDTGKPARPATDPVGRIVSPIPVGLRRILGRKTGDQANWIFSRLRKFPQLPWLVPARPQPGLLAGLTMDPRAGLNLALVLYCPDGQAQGAT